MNTLLLRIYVKFQELTYREDGQDMVEYALCLGLLCFGITAASKFISSGLSTAYSNLNTTMGNYTS